MGGGDLNLKKSWHPSTLKNIERVWKAEQKHEAEQKKIEQLQKELDDERNRQEMRQYAENQGVVRRKSERLDWMYQGPAAHVNRDDYLTGRPVDKTFDILQQLEDGNAAEKPDEDNVPTSIFGSSEKGAVTVDLANKIREDPLFMIRKQEEDNRKQLLNNPVRMKQLQQLLRQQMDKESKKKRKHKKEKKQKRKEQQHSRRRRRQHSSGSSNNSSSDEPQVVKVERKERDDRSANKHSSRRRRYDSSSDDDTSLSKRPRAYGLIQLDKSSTHRSVKTEIKQVQRPRVESKSSSDSKRQEAEKPDFKRRRRLDSSEMEKRRREMMEDAQWRDEQRNKNVQRYRKEAAKEEEYTSDRRPSPTFIAPLLSSAVSKGTLESRIKSNIYNIQRSRADLEKNFARR